jgi:hypothetical protein
MDHLFKVVSVLLERVNQEPAITAELIKANPIIRFID